MPLVGPVKKTEWWGAGVVICLKRHADLHMAQLMPLPLTVSCFSKIQIGFTFVVPAHPGNPGKRAVKRVCVLFFPEVAENSLRFPCSGKSPTIQGFPGLWPPCIYKVRWLS